MIPAPLRAPPTGITDAGYRIRLGASVFCCSHGSMSRQPRVFQTAHRAVATEMPAGRFCLYWKKTPNPPSRKATDGQAAERSTRLRARLPPSHKATAGQDGVAGAQLRKGSPAAAGKLSRRPTSTLNVHSNRPADDHKTESGKFRLLALRN